MLTLGSHSDAQLASRDFHRHLSAQGITDRRGGFQDPEPQAFVKSWFWQSRHVSWAVAPSRRSRPAGVPHCGSSTQAASPPTPATTPPRHFLTANTMVPSSCAPGLGPIGGRGLVRDHQRTRPHSGPLNDTDAPGCPPPITQQRSRVRHPKFASDPSRADSAHNPHNPDAVG